MRICTIDISRTRYQASGVGFQVSGKLNDENRHSKPVLKRRRRSAMREQQELLEYLEGLIGEEGCGVSCKDAEIFRDEGGWKLMLEGFMEPWSLGKTVEDAKAMLKEYASMGFGLSA